MTRPSLAVGLYLLNGAILLTHEIDSAYWQEWQLFGIGDLRVHLQGYVAYRGLTYSILRSSSRSSRPV